jgi:DNA-binding XRE family transcriptional regulator
VDEPCSKPLLPHLAQVLRDARTRTSCTVADVAQAAGFDASTIYRLERAVAWPRDPDSIIGAYARLTGLAPRRLWRDAVAQLPR